MRVPLHRIAAWVITALACGLVLFALVAPNQTGQLTLSAFVRIPIEALVGTALVLAIPSWPARRAIAVVAGVLLGLLTLLKIFDMGFYQVLDQPFDPSTDWPLLTDFVEFLSRSFGRGGTVALVVGAMVVAIGVLVLTTLAVLRLSRLVVRHDTASTRTVAVFTVVWVIFAAFGAPVAASSAAPLAYDRARQMYAGLRDPSVFAAEMAVDAFRDTPDANLLTALRGKDVILAFVESYGRCAVDAPQVAAVLDAGESRLRAAGFASRSAYLTSSTAGGASWLAHATLLSGLWVNNQQRHKALMETDRFTLNGAFRRAGWRTVGVMPGTDKPWPESSFYGYDELYTGLNLGYRGPTFTFASMPDQYTLAAFHRAERAAPNHPPVMAEIALLSSHGPWAPVPRMVDWPTIGDGTGFKGMPEQGDKQEEVLANPDRLRNAYRQSIEYSVSALISYVETYGDDNLVLVFLGDHQPAPIVAGEHATRDVPITIIARDPAVLARIAGWNWQDGLKPGPQAPVWRMDTFRDRFLTAFG